MGGETHVLSRGDAVHIPANTVHSVKALDNKPVHTLMFYHASGYDDFREGQAQYSEKEAQDPATRTILHKVGDFNPVKD